MPKQHNAAPGECISSIAFQYGFFADTIWDDPANAALKAERKNMNTLVPGDAVAIPEKRVKEETRGTGGLHRFQRKGVPMKLRLQVLDDDKPVANSAYEITIDGQMRTGITTDDGEVVQSIQPTARRAHLVVSLGERKLEYNLQLGRLEPVETSPGITSRLFNLGYDIEHGEDTLTPRVAEALKAFQRDNGLPVTGEPDAATQAKLREKHDGA